MRSRDLLEDFIGYCEANPDLRFWQALRNWSGHAFILCSNSAEAKRHANDTFYWDARDGLRRSVDKE
jgi:hypothetical protein